MDPYLLKRLWRRPWLTMSCIVISVLLCVLLGYLTDYRQNQEEELVKTQQTFDIRCVVTDIRASRSAGLGMSADIVAFVTGEDSPLAPYIRDVRITKEFHFTAPEMNIGTWSQSSAKYGLLGVNSEKCAQVLDNVTYLTDSFYDRQEYICLVSEEVYLSLREQFPEETEHTVTLDITEPNASIREDSDYGKATVTMRVAGYYSGMGQTVYVPFSTAMHLAVRTTYRESCDSVTFYAADNLKLEQLRAAAAEKFAQVDPSSDDPTALALVIQDEQYHSTVAVLEQNIQRTTVLLPMVMLLGLGVGFLISFLATRNEKMTYALMRTLGMTRGKLLASVLREQLLPVALGAGIGFAATGKLQTTAMYLACYSVGCVACILKAIKVPPTAILREQE